MAQRRMFSKSITESDAFIDMPLTTQALYFHLGMVADDEGFVGNPKNIMRMIGANRNDLDLLLAKNFILGFDTGIVVIKHWKINNYIQNDRLEPTNYDGERSLLLLQENNAYSLTTGEKLPLIERKKKPCIQNVSKTYTQDSIGKNSIDKDRLDKNSIEENKNNNDCVCVYSEEERDARGSGNGQSPSQTPEQIEQSNKLKELIDRKRRIFESK